MDRDASPGVALTARPDPPPFRHPRRRRRARRAPGAFWTPPGFADRIACPFPNAGTPDIDNLYARIGDGAPFLLFAGHTDVVPPGDAAKMAASIRSPARLSTARCLGRGAADMKGGIAAFAAAAFACLAKQRRADRARSAF